MKKRVIFCYSKTGNSQFIAEKLAKALDCPIEQIKPMFNNTIFLFILSALNIPISTNISKEKITSYDEIILIGPIWGGTLIAPIQSVLKKCIGLQKPVHFAVTCETKESDQDTKYGYNQVLNKVKQIGGNLVKTTTAFSMTLVEGYDATKNEIITKPKINEANYSEALKARVNALLEKINT